MVIEMQNETDTKNIREIIGELNAHEELTTKALIEVLLLTNVRIDAMVELLEIVKADIEAIKKQL